MQLIGLVDSSPFAKVNCSVKAKRFIDVAAGRGRGLPVCHGVADSLRCAGCWWTPQQYHGLRPEDDACVISSSPPLCVIHYVRAGLSSCRQHFLENASRSWAALITGKSAPSPRNHSGCHMSVQHAQWSRTPSRLSRARCVTWRCGRLLVSGMLVTVSTWPACTSTSTTHSELPMLRMAHDRCFQMPRGT